MDCCFGGNGIYDWKLTGVVADGVGKSTSPGILTFSTCVLDSIGKSTHINSRL
jgi:hypothetical protein